MLSELIGLRFGFRKTEYSNVCFDNFCGCVGDWFVSQAGCINNQLKAVQTGDLNREKGGFVKKSLYKFYKKDQTFKPIHC